MNRHPATSPSTNNFAIADNDFVATVPFWVFAFAIERSALK